MKRFWNKLTGEERLCRAEQKLTILILDCQDEERRVKLIRRKKEVHLKRLKIRRRNYIFALILACMMLILAVVKTERFDEAVSALCDQIDQAGGVVESRDISGAKNASRSANLTLRVPSDMLDGVLSGAGEWGEVTREQTSAVDMTSTYTDNASRLESARAKKRQLDALYEKAENMEDIITLTDAIFDVQEEIEWLEGQNRRIDNQASMATLYVTINEKSSAVSAKQPFFTRLGRQLADGWENFGEFVSNAVLGLTYALPWVAAAAAGAVMVRAAIRKKKKH